MVALSLGDARRNKVWVDVELAEVVQVSACQRGRVSIVRRLPFSKSCDAPINGKKASSRVAPVNDLAAVVSAGAGEAPVETAAEPSKTSSKSRPACLSRMLAWALRMLTQLPLAEVMSCRSLKTRRSQSDSRGQALSACMSPSTAGVWRPCIMATQDLRRREG